MTPAEQILAIQDWRHPYQIGAQETALDKSWYREWHPWRWSIDRPVIETALGGFKGSTVLDVACNDGWYGFQCAKEGASVLGLDARDDAIERARLLNTHFKHDNIRHEVRDIEDPAALTGSYDATLFYGILYHLADPIKSLVRIGERTDRIVAVQTFINAFDREPMLRLIYEDVAEVGNGMTSLVTTPSQAAVVRMLNFAGFKSVFRAMPRQYLARRLNSTADTQWAFFYGIKGEASALDTLPDLRRITDQSPPLNHFSSPEQLASSVKQSAKRLRTRALEK